MNLKIKLHDLKCAPTRAYAKDAGLDCYARIDKLISITQFTTVKIPLGISVEIPEHHMGSLLPRSGLASKGISAEIGTIDCGYTGEVCAIITNNTGLPYHIEPYAKIAQLIIIPIAEIEVIEFVSDLPSTDRGNAGFGSTDKGGTTCK